ncbi:hypothetical protein I552_8556 [Mycobacterium xenopi 3993]|nr:hypothetical protein I552_8556 [Mycobacterium xenopi 3993]
MQTLRPHIGPVLSGVVQRCSLHCLAVNRPTASYNLDQVGPKAVLLLVANQGEKTAITTAEGIDPH